MYDRKNVYHVLEALLAVFILFLCVGNASAYIGPGADLGLLTYALGLAAWVIAAFSTLMLWPLYAFTRWMRGNKKKAATAPPAAATEPTVVGELAPVTEVSTEPTPAENAVPPG